MPFKVGDHVKYLNEEGGGVIVGLISNDIAKVEDEHGFIFELAFSDIVAENKSVLNTKAIHEKMSEFNLDGSNPGMDEGERDYKLLLREYLLVSRNNWTSKRKDFVEIDLHIEEFIKKPQALEHGQKLQLQLDHARNCLDAAHEMRIVHLVFIHGVGAGVLKNELRKWLETLDFISFENADYAEYGVGATQVRVHGSYV